MSEIAVAVKIVVENEKNQILLIKRGFGVDIGTWDAPGGKLEYGETLEECGIREFKEETSLDVELGDFIGVTEMMIKEKNKYVIFLYYKGIITGGKLQHGTDALDAKWVDRSRIFEVENLRPLFKDLLKKNNLKVKKC